MWKGTKLRLKCKFYKAKLKVGEASVSQQNQKACTLLVK